MSPCISRCDCSKAGWSSSGRSKVQFDGPRCQLTRHSFQGGYALFAPFTQCEESTISIEILPKKEDGLIFYNGPTSTLGRDDPTDYIALWMKDGYPVLSVSCIHVLNLEILGGSCHNIPMFPLY